MPVPPSEIQRPDLHQAILQALHRAYDVNRERHDPGVGDTALTFGIHTWTSSIHYLQIELAGVEGVTCSVVNQSIEIRLGRCRLRVLKLGNSEADNPWHSYPDHVGPASRMGRCEQLVLDLGLEEIEPLDWIIGHYGCAEDGLRAVRLQAVGSERSEDGRITRWSAIVPIFEMGDTPVTLTVIDGDQSDVVPIPEPEVALKEDPKEEKGNQGQPS
jgi:hypothetical protein